MTRIHKLTAVAASAAMVAGAGLGVADAATSSKQRPANARKAPGRPPALTTAQLATIASKLGVSASDLKAAVDAAKPARPANGQKPAGGPPGPGGPGGRGGEDLAAKLATALNADATKVKEIFDANRPAKPAERPAEGTKPPKPDHTALIAALASGLGLEQSAVQAAFDKLEADRPAKPAAGDNPMVKAVAEKLGKSVTDVAAAFESVRPAKPAR